MCTHVAIHKSGILEHTQRAQTRPLFSPTTRSGRRIAGSGTLAFESRFGGRIYIGLAYHTPMNLALVGKDNA